MSSLSIRNMNVTLQEMENIRDKIDWESYLARKAKTQKSDVFDWLIQRPSRRGKKKKVFVCFLYFYTKKEFSEWWKKHAQKGWTARVFTNHQLPPWKQ